MYEVVAGSLDAVLSRFFQFYDAVVRRVDVDFAGGRPQCEIVIDAQDAESTSGWSRVVFRMVGVEQFRLEMGKTTFQVLSSGIQIGWHECQVFLFLDAFPDDDELPKVSSNRAYFAGDALFWTVGALER
ncbi:MAG: hypothetical protein ABMB14_40155 [Myxococcota bacterium]